MAVAVGGGGRSGVVRPFEEEAFIAAVSEGGPVRPLVARGHIDRTVFGALLTRQAFLARSWEPRGPVMPVAIAGPSGPEANVAPAYFAHGFQVATTGPSGESASVHRGGGQPNCDPWESPNRTEDHLLQALWQRRSSTGWWLAEVPVGGRSPRDSRARRFDAVVLPWPEPRHSPAGCDLQEFGRVVEGGVDVELIEAKPSLSSDAIGQLVSGAFLFSRSWPGHGTLGYTLCVGDRNDAALEWFCRRSGMRVELIGP